VTGLRSLLVGSTTAPPDGQRDLRWRLRSGTDRGLSFYLAVQEEVSLIFCASSRRSSIMNMPSTCGSAPKRRSAIGSRPAPPGVVVGILVYLVLMVVGIPHALVLALLAAMFEIIPVFGPIIRLCRYSARFRLQRRRHGLLLICLYIIIYQFESQLFYPLVVKKIVGISPIVVILALVIGAKLAVCLARSSLCAFCCAYGIRA